MNIKDLKRIILQIYERLLKVMEETTFVKCEPECLVDAEESSRYGLPLKADHDGTGDIKIQPEHMATLLPKVERESSPSGWCEGNRRGSPSKTDPDDAGNIKIQLEDMATLLPKFENESSPSGWCEGSGGDEEQLSLHINDGSSKSSDVVDQNQANEQGKIGCSVDLGEPSFQQVGKNVHYYITSTGDLCIGTSGTMEHMHHTGESLPSSVQALKSEGWIIPVADRATNSCNSDIKCKDDNFQEGGRVSDTTFAVKDALSKHPVTRIDDETLICTICQHISSGRLEHANHMETHAIRKLHVCPYCEQEFGKHCNLQWHIAATHPKNRNIICKTCGFPFPRPQSREMHSMVHTSGNPYFCAICGKGFIQRSALLKHQDIHIGNNSYCCTNCGRGFNRKATFQKQVVTHLGDKLHNSTHCGEATSKLISVQSKMLSDTKEKSYVCTFCSKVFMSNDTLNLHLLTHTGGKLQMCKWCGQAFPTSSDLRTHLVTHTIEKPFLCLTCEMTFTQRGKLQAHLLTHNE